MSSELQKKHLFRGTADKHLAPARISSMCRSRCAGQSLYAYTSFFHLRWAQATISFRIYVECPRKYKPRCERRQEALSTATPPICLIGGIIRLHTALSGPAMRLMEKGTPAAVQVSNAQIVFMSQSLSRPRAQGCTACYLLDSEDWGIFYQRRRSHLGPPKINVLGDRIHN